MKCHDKIRNSRAFTLVEILLALSISIGILALIAQVLLSETAHSRRLSFFLRERTSSERALELIRSEIRQTTSLGSRLPSAYNERCISAGRELRLALQVAEGQILYLIDQSPAAIWRGVVLMRCGPSYGLDGQMNPGTNIPSVLMDGILGSGFQWSQSQDGIILTLERSLSDGSGFQPLVFKVTKEVAVPSHIIQ